MSTPTIGAYSGLGIAEEGTYGTAETSFSNWLPVLPGMSLQRKREHEPRNHLGIPNATAIMRAGTFVTKDLANGQIPIELSYDDSCLTLLKYLFGAVADSGSGPYNHAFTLAHRLATGLTMRARRGMGTNAKAEVFAGCMVQKGTIVIEPEKMAELRLDILAKTSAGEVSQGSTSFNSSAEGIAYNHWGQFTWNSVARSFKRLEITIDRGITERMLVGSLNSARPVEGNFPRVTGRITVEQGDGGDWYAASLSDTYAAGSLSATGSGNNACAIALHRMQMTAPRDTVPNGPGVMDETFEFECFHLKSGSDYGIALTMTNDNALYSAN